MFAPVTVLKWDAQSGGRISSPDGNLYILNTKNMFEIKPTYNSKLTLTFFDNPNDTRDGGNRMKIDTTIAAVYILADTDYGDESVTLDYYPDDDSTQATKEITLIKKNVSYFFPYRNDQTNALSWVIYCEDAWNVKRILVNHSWIPLYALMEE